jgi:tripartite-type tricarboxylate transporter receptor subunit TctC
MSPTLFARPFAAPPGVPQERVDALRSAFRQTLRDPAFIADAEKKKIEIEYVSDAEIVSVLKRLYDTPPAVVARVKAALK